MTIDYQEQTFNTNPKKKTIYFSLIKEKIVRVRLQTHESLESDFSMTLQFFDINFYLVLESTSFIIRDNWYIPLIRLHCCDL